VPKSPSGLLKAFKKLQPTTPGRIGWDPVRITGSEPERRARAQDPLVRDVITIGAANSAQEAARTFRDRIGTIAIPLLLLEGSEDAIAGSGPAAIASAPDTTSAKRLVFEGLRHDLFHESRSADVVSALADWLDATLPR
jgi:alpha-beta hydrolase superfamily lysophospholipase